MIVFDSRKGRRVLCRLERGEELVGSLAALCAEQKIRAAWVRGYGTLEWVELTRHDQAEREPESAQRFEGGSELLTLTGSVAVDLESGAPEPRLHATLSRRTDNGVALLGGELRSARVHDVELVLEVFDDVRLERAQDDDTGLALWRGAPTPGVSAPRSARGLTDAPAAAEAAPSPTAVGWGDVMAASAEPKSPAKAPRGGRARRSSADQGPPATVPDRSREATWLEEEFPEKGDWIEHRQFGLCEIIKEDEGGGLVIRLPSGRRKTIRLDFMEVLAPKENDGKRVFPVRPKRRG